MKGNDLSTPAPNARFPGLKPGNKWCLCVYRWLQAYQDGVAPPIIFESTNANVLKIVPLRILLAHRDTL
jgi:uncharacterized protein (DUF2237 family)